MKLYNKDCMEMFSEIGDASVDLFISDVPYKTTSRGNAGNSDGMLQKKMIKKIKVILTCFKHLMMIIHTFSNR